ncbi:NUDIX hydrolase [Rhodoferax antarcticus]|uniref:NUDIX hydrolase n=1 Tax=Rhodoferax antarcticus TaxID=81479 RepID=UPI002224B1A6|nr:NUDIX hydrolase [Rhodoferax antarcticus]MCW2313997.1 8-oxo-dGTP pyrophosphatase MutT (NUDIX family) [Rhodoferax antarcticus]
MLHRRKNDQGLPVRLIKPSWPTAPAAWGDGAALARVVPGGPLPGALNGLALAPWRDVPGNAPAWEALASTMPVDEPPFDAPQGFKKAAGVVVREPDGRLWVVAPSNAFGGYQATFPKGGMDGKSARATALAEAFEETGLQVRLSGFLVDALRSTSYTRYFLAERVGGTPAAMGWESQAVMLVPLALLSQVLNSPRDLPIIEALEKT